jgi:hypothetical protein
MRPTWHLHVAFNDPPTIMTGLDFMYQAI